MFENPKNLSEQLCNLSERLGIEMRALNRTKVSTVNGIVPDANGNVTIEVGSGGGVGGSGDAIPRTGNRGTLAGYEEFVSSVESFGMVEITENAPDISMAAIVNAPNSTLLPEETDTEVKMKSMTKVVLLLNEGGAQVNLDTYWFWKDNTVPTFSALGLLIFHVPPYFEPVGFVTYVPLIDEF